MGHCPCHTPVSTEKYMDSVLAGCSMRNVDEVVIIYGKPFLC